MKKTYVFFGQLTEIEGVAKLSTFGQNISLGENFVHDLMVNSNGCSLVPEETFAGIGFTLDELKDIRNSRRTDSVVRKLDDLLVAHRNWVASLSKPTDEDGAIENEAFRAPILASNDEQDT